MVHIDMRMTTINTKQTMRKTILIHLICMFYSSVAEIIPYKEHVIYPLYPEYLTISKFAPGDAPKWSPGHGKSYIDLSGMKVTLKCDADKKAGSICKDSSFEILMFEEPPAKPWMDYWPDRQFCCTSDMVKAGE